MLEFYKGIKKIFNENEIDVKFHYYDVNKNAKFKDLVNSGKDLPALRVFQ